MSARVQSRRPSSKRRLSEGGTSTMRKAVRDLDLNRAPDGGTSASASPEVALSLTEQQSSQPTLHPPLASAVTAAVQPPDQAIVIPDEDDDVVLLSSSTNPPSQVRGTPTVPVILIDEDSDASQGHSHSGVVVQEPVSRLALYGYSRSERNPHKRLIINCEEYESQNYYPCTKVVETVQLQKVVPPLPPPPPKEPVFNCSICLGELDEATSTICGHIFCQKCLRASLQTQKKCPTCRKPLTGRNVMHRVYLPTTK